MLRRIPSLSIRRCLAVAATSAAAVATVGFVAPDVALASNGRADILLSASPNPVVYGQPVTLSAELDDNSGSCIYWGDCDAPQGTVLFFDNGVYIGGGVLGDHGPDILHNHSFTEFVTTALQVGFHHYSAQYQGDFDSVSTNDLQSIGKGSPDLTVNKAPCTLGLSPDRFDVSHDTSPVMFTADFGSGGHAGTVDLLDDNNRLFWRSTINPDGQTATSSFLVSVYGPGTYTFHAHYYGDNHYLECTSPAVSIVIPQSHTASGEVFVPTAVDDQFPVDADTPTTVDVLANDTHLDQGPVEPAIKTGPSHGTATIDPTTLLLTYTPDAGYVGPDSLLYRLANADHPDASFGDPAQVTFDVECRAAGHDDSFTVVRDTPLVVADAGVLGNDQACAGGATVVTQPTHGSVALGTAGGFTYTPASGFTGADSFRYTLDEDAPKTPVTVTLVVVDPACAVTLGDDTYSTTGALVVTAPGVAVNDELCGNAVDVAQPPAHGTVVITPGGGFTYTPEAAYAGPDTFTYGIAEVPDEQPSQRVEAIDPTVVATVHLAVVAAEVTTTSPPTTAAPTTTAAPAGPAVAPTPLVGDPVTSDPVAADPAPVAPPSDVLPATGSNPMPTALVALAAVLAGAALVRLTRRRRTVP